MGRQKITRRKTAPARASPLFHLLIYTVHILSAVSGVFISVRRIFIYRKYQYKKYGFPGNKTPEILPRRFVDLFSVNNIVSSRSVSNY